jgi:hypothetical protein
MLRFGCALIVVACIVSNANTQNANRVPKKSRPTVLVDPGKDPTKDFARVTYESNFNKKQGMPNSCFTLEGMNHGNTLACPIDLDSINAPGRIVDVHMYCSPSGSGACQHTVQCPGGGICDKHIDRSTPNPSQLVNGKYRKLTWYGWTDNGDNATLTIVVYVDPKPL